MFFESPRRLAACLRDAVEVLGPDRRAVVCRELTKTHEEIVRGSLAELADWAADGVLGEITVVLAGAEPRADLETLVAEVNALVVGRCAREGCLRRGDFGASGGAVAARALRCGSAFARLSADDRRRLVQAFVPFAVGIGVRRDAAPNAEHGRPVGAELHRADRHVEFTARDG